MTEVLHVITDMNIGGAGQLVCNLLRHGNRDEFAYSVAVPQGSMLVAPLKSLEVSLYEIDRMQRSADFSSLHQICKIIKKRKIQVLHSHSALFSRVGGLLCGVPVKINTKHCFEEMEKKRYFMRHINRAADILFTDCTVATAEYVQRGLVQNGLSQKKIKLIINGSTPREIYDDERREEERKKLGISNGELAVGIVARLAEGKGHSCFLEAAYKCEKIGASIKFFIVGDGVLKDELVKNANGLKNLKFLGFISDVTPIMNALDVNVNCSVASETSSLSLSEGMSVGVIPIVSKCGGNPFMAENCGFVFEKNDSTALASILIELSKNKNLLNDMKKAASLRFCNEFTADIMAEKYEELYRELLIKSFR